MKVGTGFAAGLLAVYFVPSVGVAIYLMLAFVASVLGGLTIGRWWAVAIALGTNLAFSALLVCAGALVFQLRPHHDLGSEITLLLGQIFVSTAATALAVWLRRTVASPSARPS